VEILSQNHFNSLLVSNFSSVGKHCNKLFLLFYALLSFEDYINSLLYIIGLAKRNKYSNLPVKFAT